MAAFTAAPLVTSHFTNSKLPLSQADIRAVQPPAGKRKTLLFPDFNIFFKLFSPFPLGVPVLSTSTLLGAVTADRQASARST